MSRATRRQVGFPPPRDSFTDVPAALPCRDPVTRWARRIVLLAVAATLTALIACAGIATIKTLID